jgi:hypothetical protein
MRTPSSATPRAGQRSTGRASAPDFLGDERRACVGRHLGVESALPIEGMAGYAAANGDALAQWLGPFLTAPEQHDVLQKLGRSRCAQRHAFVIFPGFTPAPFEVVDILVRDHAPPAVDPDLPPEVTDVWAVSVWSTGTGFRWSPGTGWLPFAKDGATVPSGSGD